MGLSPCENKIRHHSKIKFVAHDLESRIAHFRPNHNHRRACAVGMRRDHLQKPRHRDIRSWQSRPCPSVAMIAWWKQHNGSPIRESQRHDYRLQRHWTIDWTTCARDAGYRAIHPPCSKMVELVAERCVDNLACFLLQKDINITRQTHHAPSIRRSHWGRPQHIFDAIDFGKSGRFGK